MFTEFLHGNGVAVESGGDWSKADFSRNKYSRATLDFRSLMGCLFY
jgi:hypothetical protein